MNFDAFMRDIERLEKINHEIELLKNPGCIAEKTERIFPKSERQKMVDGLLQIWEG